MGMVMGAMAVMQAVSAIKGGMDMYSASKSEAGLQRQQANIALQESQFAAQQKARSVTSFQAEQSNLYANSGITLEGSPAMVLEETRRLGQQEVDALWKSGYARHNMMMAQARQTQNVGRNALIGGFIKAGGSAANAYLMGKGIGVYGNAPTTLNPTTPINPVASYNGAIQ